MESSMENFISSVSGESYLRVQDDLGHGFVRLRAAEAQRRQAKQDIRFVEDIVIELLRNARDAHARAIFLATWTEGDHRFLTMLDDGDGIPAELHQAIFEPFVTSKLDTFHSDHWGVHGRGMALYSIKENAEQASVICSKPGLGSVFGVTVNVKELPEKRDQSTFPKIVINDEGKPVLRGPHNITRTVLEFAIEERSHISVYLGSPASIVAALYELGSSAAARLTTIFDTYDEKTPYLQRFAFADDPDELQALAGQCGFPLSVRTARRIMNQEIKPAVPQLALLSQAGPDGEGSSSAFDKASAGGGKPGEGKGGKAKPKASVKLAPEDLRKLSDEVRTAYQDLASAYYLDPDAEPAIQVRGDELSIRIPLRASDV